MRGNEAGRPVWTQWRLKEGESAWMASGGRHIGIGDRSFVPLRYPRMQEDHELTKDLSLPVILKIKMYNSLHISCPLIATIYTAVTKKTSTNLGL